MFKIIVIFTYLAVACYGAPQEPSGVYCGNTPDQIYKCLNNPMILSRHEKCSKLTSKCEKMTCIFRESNWLDGAAVNKAKLTAYFDQYAKNHPEWSPAVQHLKLACLGSELKTQGVYLNCPSYDIIHCALSSFIKHATPSQWLTTEECAYPRAYATSCPVCPDECYAPQIPLNSCNACYSQYSLPQTP